MAKTQPIVVSGTFVDEWGIEASAPYYALADPSLTITAMLAEANALLGALQAASDAHISHGHITMALAAPAPTGVATAGSRVEQTGVLNFSSTGTSKRWGGYVPAISNGATVLSGDRIVLTGVDPVGLLVAILTTVGTVLAWCSAHNQQIVAFVDAIVAFHKRRKQLQRASFEV
jgi:hypothetical protein